jgi:thiamine-monophosphate kinase
MKEFELIDHLQHRFAAHAQSCPHAPVLGMGDDAAILAVPQGRQLVVSTDTLVSDVHFFATDSASDIAAKSLAVNLSDLAAMGAEPAWFFLAISLPEIDSAWCDEFATGLLEMAEYGRIQLAGGDTTRGPLSMTVTVMGLVDEGKALRRDGAHPGELVVVSGQPGLAALALQQRKSGETSDATALLALKRPQPRLALGQALLGKASACIDVSDGLVADLRHILRASGCGAEIRLEQLPQHPAFAGLDANARWALQLGGGDDYELCFVLPRQHEPELRVLQEQLGLGLHVIGETTIGDGLKILQAGGREYALQHDGFEHFSD